MTRNIPELIRLYLRNIAFGFLLSAIFVAALLWQDVMGLRGLITGVDGGWIAALMLFMFNGLVFSGVQFAVAVMLMAEKEDDDPKGGRRAPARAAAPTYAEARVTPDSKRT